MAISAQALFSDSAGYEVVLLTAAARTGIRRRIGRDKEGVNFHQSLKSPSGELCFSHSVFTDWDDQIVDVHEKTTTIEVSILCTPY